MSSKTNVVKHMERLYSCLAYREYRIGLHKSIVNVVRVSEHDLRKANGPHVIFLSREECSGSGRSSAAVERTRGGANGMHAC